MEKTCEICGKSFITNRVNTKVCSNECREKRKTKMLDYYRSINYKYDNKARRTKIKGLEFTLTLEQFDKIKHEPCHYCGDLHDIMDIDRKDSRKGYTPDNSVSSCHICNIMKNIVTGDDFIFWCEKITNHQKKLSELKGVKIINSTGNEDDL